MIRRPVQRFTIVGIQSQDGIGRHRSKHLLGAIHLPSGAKDSAPQLTQRLRWWDPTTVGVPVTVYLIVCLPPHCRHLGLLTEWP